MPKYKDMRVARIIHGSYVNGPGQRNVLWVQGCTIGCEGCFNTHTWESKKGALMSIDEVVKELLEYKVGYPGGLTVSGGEPMEQWSAVKETIRMFRDANGAKVSVLMFTGWTRDMLVQRVGYEELCEYVDVAVAGPYMGRDPERTVAAGLVTSGNQEVIILTNAHTLEEIMKPAEYNIEIHCEGESTTISGFPSQEQRTQIIRELK